MNRMPPRIAGRALVALRVAAEAPGTGAAVRQSLRHALGVSALGDLPEAYRGDTPMEQRPVQARARRTLAHAGLALPSPAAWVHGSAAYGRAYGARESTPREVVARGLAALDELASRRPTMNLVACRDDAAARRDAEASTARWASGASLGPLDGVPFLVKDQHDVAGLPTRLGTICEPDQPARADATVVARLRAAGAIVLAKTVLTEWGMSPIGANVHQAMPHNAHDTSRAAGGSSTGSAVGVALGLVPFATAGDGGGSIRIPAALNGVFGLKPTFGRVSRAGDLFKGSVAHVGPIAATTSDLAAFLDRTSTHADPGDTLTSWAPGAPEGGFGARLGAGVAGLTIGVPEAEWGDASPEVARRGREALAALEREGARLVPVALPLARHAAPIGYLAIGPESLASVRRAWLEQRDRIADDLRVSFAALSGFSALEVLDAARLRMGLRAEIARALREVDVLALPTTAITAPRYTEADARESFSDPAALDGLCRFAFLANLTGLPAGTAPVGHDAGGLPVGLQIVGDAWDEATVLGVLAHLERTEVASVRRPAGAVDLLG